MRLKVPLAATRLLLNSIEFDIPDEKYILLENEVNRINEYVEQVLYVARLDSFSKDYLVRSVIESDDSAGYSQSSQRVHSEEYSLCD